MMLRPMKNDETMGLDFSMTVNAVASACQGLGKMTLTMLTENKSDQDEWEGQYKTTLKNENQHLTFKCQPIENEKDLKDQIGKSHLFLFPMSSSLFRQEALAAAASGIPVLVSSHSGVGSFLQEMNEMDSIVDELDQRSWEKRISEKITNPAASQEKAAQLRERLLLDTRIASTHQDFTKLLLGELLFSRLKTNILVSLFNFQPQFVFLHNELFLLLDAACAEIELKMVSDPSVSDEAIDIAKQIGVNDTNDLHHPESYMTSFFQQILLLRDKLEMGLLQNYLTEDVEVKWQELLSSLEQGRGRLLYVQKGCIMFTLFCPTAESFDAIRTSVRPFEDMFKVFGNFSLFSKVVFL